MQIKRIPRGKPEKRPYIPEFENPEQFVDEKIKMLTEDFKINLTYEDKKYLRSFKTENHINTAVRTIFNKYWE